MIVNIKIFKKFFYAKANIYLGKTLRLNKILSHEKELEHFFNTLKSKKNSIIW